MTYQDIIDTFEKYPNIKVDLWNLKDQNELDKYDKYGLTPEIIFSKFIKVVVEEFIYTKFKGLDIGNNNYTFNMEPIEFIVCVEFHDNMPTLVNKIIDLYPNTDELLKYINEHNV